MQFVAKLLSAALVALSPYAMHAQEMRPLSNLIQDAAPSYPYVRCAGLHLALLEWAGKPRLGESVWNRLDGVRADCMVAAVVTGVSDGTWNEEQGLANVTRDTRNVADLYRKRFEMNYAREGQAFNTDPLVQEDLGTCAAVVQHWRSIIGAR